MKAHHSKKTNKKITRKPVNITLSTETVEHGKAIAVKTGHRSLSGLVEHLINKEHELQAA